MDENGPEEWKDIILSLEVLSFSGRKVIRINSGGQEPTKSARCHPRKAKKLNN